jgi:Domain of Unknown Function (DUF1259)
LRSCSQACFRASATNGANARAPDLRRRSRGHAELIGGIVAASTITGVFFKLPSGALSDVRMRRQGRSYVDTFVDLIRWNNAEQLFVQVTSGQGAGGALPGMSPLEEEVMMRVMFSLLVSIFAMALAGVANAQEIDWKKVDDALGRPGAVSADVHRYGFPRTDLQVTLDGVTIRPALALGGWAAFKPAHGGAMVMGDLVLLETEINPVMSKLIENGLEITAIHNHVLRGSPATFYMHIGGHGDPVKLATALRTALAESKTPLTPPAVASPPPAIDLDTAQLDQIIGAKGQANGGVYQFGVPRRDAITDNGMQIALAGPMGVATAINFQPTGGGKAAITGDFVLTGEEVNPVIKALRANGIEVTAIHSHMLTKQPQLIFMHFWANDDAIKLAKGLRAALDKTASAKS